MIHPCGDYSRSIIVSHFLIAAVHYCFISGVFNDSGLEIIRDQESWDTFKIFICVHMCDEPVLRLHIAEQLCIRIAAARQHAYEQICITHCTCNRISDRQGPSCPIDLKLITGLVMDAHSSLGLASPVAVYITELAVLVRNSSCIYGFDLVFFPKKCKVDTFAGQFLVDPFTIGFHPDVSFVVTFRIELLIEQIVVYFITNRPGHVLLVCSLVHITDSAPG